MKNPEQIIKTYQQIIQKSECELQKVRKRIHYISLLRLLLFIGAMTNAYVFWSDGGMKWWLLVLIPLVLFFWLVKRHTQWFHRKDELEKIIMINEQELKGLKYDFSAFDAGEEFINPEHLYTYDLDVFGKHSIFQSINRTSTPIGKHFLAQWLNNHLTHQEAIEQRQEAVRELTPALEYRQQIRLLGLLYAGNPTDMADIQKWAESPSYFLRNKWLRFLPWIVGIINVMCWGMAALGILSINFVGGILVGFIFFSTVFSRRITKFQETYGKKLQILSIYAEQILCTEKKEMNSLALRKLKEKLSGNGQSASAAVYELAKLMNGLDQRNNVLMSSLLNGLLLWELAQVMRIERWKEKHARLLPVWIEVVGEIEAYCSLATFAYNHPQYQYPSISTEPFQLTATALGHPLMAADKCVCNDIDIRQKPFFIIITGANMAGKSTYLRTIGVNYLLACIGAPVWASKMTIYPAQLVTSLRTADSLADNESYFFAELKRLKRIIDLLQSGRELFIVLDEILKGTNSMDKQKGSLALIQQFLGMQANGIIATHDLLLGSLIETFPQYIKNYCFEADVQQDELTFSYRMREGIAQNMNACFLMKKMGIVGLS